MHFNESRLLTQCPALPQLPPESAFVGFSSGQVHFVHRGERRALSLCSQARRSTGRKEEGALRPPLSRQPRDYLICKVHLNPSQILSVWSRGHPDGDRWCGTPLLRNMEMRLWLLLKVVQAFNCCHSLGGLSRAGHKMQPLLKHRCVFSPPPFLCLKINNIK